MSGDAGADDAETRERLAGELRRRVGAELRAEAEEGERLAAASHRRRRALVDVAREAQARGDTLLVVVGGHAVTGTVRHAAADLLTVESAAGRVDVNLDAPAALRVVDRAGSGGREPDSGPGSFKARLYELELEGRVVRIGCPLLGAELGVRVEAVAVDHVAVVDADGTRWFLPLPAVEWVAER